MTIKPTCKVVGTDGNVFAIIGTVSKTLKRAGLRDQAKEWAEKAMKCGDYGEVLRLMYDYVDPE